MSKTTGNENENICYQSEFMFSNGALFFNYSHLIGGNQCKFVYVNGMECIFIITSFQLFSFLFRFVWLSFSLSLSLVSHAFILFSAYLFLRISFGCFLLFIANDFLPILSLSTAIVPFVIIESKYRLFHIFIIHTPLYLAYILKCNLSYINAQHKSISYTNIYTFRRKWVEKK